MLTSLAPDVRREVLFWADQKIKGGKLYKSVYVPAYRYLAAKMAERGLIADHEVEAVARPLGRDNQIYEITEHLSTKVGDVALKMKQLEMPLGRAVLADEPFHIKDGTVTRVSRRFTQSLHTLPYIVNILGIIVEGVKLYIIIREAAVREGR